MIGQPHGRLRTPTRPRNGPRPWEGRVRRPQGAEYPGMIRSANENKHNGRAPEIAPLRRPNLRSNSGNPLSGQAKHAAAAPPSTRVTAAATDAGATPAPFPHRARPCVRLGGRSRARGHDRHRLPRLECRGAALPGDGRRQSSGIQPGRCHDRWNRGGRGRSGRGDHLRSCRMGHSRLRPPRGLRADDLSARDHLDLGGRRLRGGEIPRVGRSLDRGGTPSRTTARQRAEREQGPTPE